MRCGSWKACWCSRDRDIVLVGNARCLQCSAERSGAAAAHTARYAAKRSASVHSTDVFVRSAGGTEGNCG